ncbi:MAG: hypothetical protein ACLT2F_08090 [Butyricicoccus sp.]
MVVHGDNKPEKITANSMPNKPGAWVVRLNARQTGGSMTSVTEVADGSTAGACE